MKNTKSHKNVAFAAALVACMSFAATAVAQQADKTQEKLRLMVTAVSARDSGDLETSKKALEDLLKIAPNDQGVQKLLSDVNAEIEAAKKAPQVDVKPAEAAAEGDAEVVAIDEAMINAQRKQQKIIISVQDMIAEAYDNVDNGRFEEALQVLAAAEEKLPDTKVSEPVKDEIRQARADIALIRTKKAAAEKNMPDAKAFAAEYASLEVDTEKGQSVVDRVEKLSGSPYNHSLEEVSPDYVARQKRVDALLEKGRIQYLYGDYQGAVTTYRTVVSLDSDNLQAKGYLNLINKKLGEAGALTYAETRNGMLDEVNRSWQRPQIFTTSASNVTGSGNVSPTKVKLSEIVLPEVSFPEPGVSLTDALNTLAQLSIVHDKSAKGPKGVNIIARDVADAKNVSLTVRDMTLEQILGFVTKQVGCQYDIEDGAIIVSKATNTGSFETFEFPVSSATVIRMVGLPSGGAASSDSEDIFGGGDTTEASPDQSEQKIKAFLEKAGVDFGPGASLAFDGTKLWVTNSSKNIEKVRRILFRYNEVMQVEIEAKFMEVNQGNLREMGFNWSVSNANGNKLFGTFDRSVSTVDGVTSVTTSGLNGRTLATSFASNSSSRPVTITQSGRPAYTTTSGGVTQYVEAVKGSSSAIEQNFPSLPSTINIAEAASPTVNTVLGIINGYNVDFLVNALEQQTGNDLLCAPKVTVVSGSKATITVAQEMLYPTTWGDTQSNVGTSSSNSEYGSSAGVTITPGTPQDFTKRDVGVTMDVTPRVEEDGSISLEMNPKVTEFEGFMEYGGVAIAISSGTTVTVPSGFIQPVFSVREVNTSVTVFDGATVVLGGLTREEVLTINDQVPVLGDIPLIGRLFQSKGESRQKKNLLIFVTANRISPGGSLLREQIGDVRPGSVYQNPIVVSPSGAVKRVMESEAEANIE